MSRLLSRNLANKRVLGFLGGTNSGKTTHALKHLVDAPDGGVYCGPLRLLAHQVCEDVKQSRPCSLVTGEVSVVDPLAKIVSCTVEMASQGRSYASGAESVTVIDEIQLIGDSHRGWAWTSAITSSTSPTLILCGSLAAQPLLESLIPHIEIRRFERLSQLHVAKHPVDHQQLRDGDAIVTFSRRQLFSLKQSIERNTGKKVAVVYGALPPEERVHQAELFNSRKSPLLVCTDAIGLGLNLDINRVIFERIDKFAPSNEIPDGEKSRRLLTASEVQQIAGRAGRGNKVGQVAAFTDRNLQFLERTMKLELPKIEYAGVAVTYEQLQFLSAKYDCAQLSDLYDFFEEDHKVDERFRLCSMKDEKAIATILDGLFPDEEMDLEMKHMYSMAPLDADDALELEYLENYSSQHVNTGRVRLDLKLRKLRDNLGDDAALRRIRVLESIYSISSIYLWLSQRFSEKVYVDQSKAQTLKDETIRQLNAILDTLGEAGQRRRRHRRYHTAEDAHSHFLKSVSKRKRKNTRKRKKPFMSKY